MNKSANTIETLPFVTVTQEWDIIDAYFKEAFSEKKSICLEKAFVNF